MQNTPPVMPSASSQNNYTNQNNGRATGGQPSVNTMNGGKREADNARSPLADSFVL
jgi:hypothetical protein